jgi:phage-related protein
MYLTRINNVIHVLHCFKKHTKKTDKRDIETGRSRLSIVQQRLRDLRIDKPG